MFSEYAAAGWVLCPIRPGSKMPLGEAWNLRENGIRDPVKAASMRAAGLCHAWSGTCAFDVDHWGEADKFLAERGIVLEALFDAEDSVHLVSGRGGHGKLLYRLPIARRSVSLAPYKAPGKKDPTKTETFHGFEFRCGTAGGLSVQDVLAPSIHPDTGIPYSWEYGDRVLGHWSQLPKLPAALDALWAAQIEPVTAQPVETVLPRGATLGELAAILAQEDPNDCAYDEWLNAGLMLHHETGGSPAGYALWCAWSSRCAKHDAMHMPVKWESFGKTGGARVTVGSYLQKRVAAPSEFGLTSEETTDVGVDTRLSTAVGDILESRIVYLLDQERYYHKPALRSEPRFTEGLDTVGDQGLKATAFDILYSPFMPWEELVGKNGETKRKKVDPRQAIRNSRRIPKVNGVGFHPGEGRIFTERDGKRYLNEFEPIHVEALRPKPSELEAWHFLLTRIEEPLFRRWLLKFYAHALAKPGVKISAAPLLVSDTAGTGKTTWMQTIPALVFGSRWVKEVSSDMINKTFNSFLTGAWFIAIEEMKTDGHRMDRIQIANRMKPWITSATIPVEFKGLNAYNIVNRVQITASSNFSDNAIHLQNDDRRWGVAQMVEKAMTEAEKASLYTDFLSTPRGAGVVKWFLQQETLTGFSPNARPPDTVGKRAMISSGLGIWETTVAEAMARGKPPFDRDIVTASDVQDYLRNTGSGHVTAKRVGMLMRKPPFNAHVVRTENGPTYCWRNAKLWREHTPIAHFKHTEDGTRPTGEWPLKVPLAILQAAGHDEDPNSVDDLLGDFNG